MPPDAGALLLAEIDGLATEHLVETSAQKINTSIKKLDIPETEKGALSKSRNGQGSFRDNLLAYWNSKCAVSAFGIKALLRASHIKPWSVSNNSERLDVYNGILLSPAHDAAFDKGFISFADDGRMLVSSSLVGSNLVRLGIKSSARLSKVEPNNRRYLTFHREHIFKADLVLFRLNLRSKAATNAAIIQPTSLSHPTFRQAKPQETFMFYGVGV